jgi:hypothetical protein
MDVPSVENPYINHTHTHAYALSSSLSLSAWGYNRFFGVDEYSLHFLASFFLCVITATDVVDVPMFNPQRQQTCLSNMQGYKSWRGAFESDGQFKWHLGMSCKSLDIFHRTFGVTQMNVTRFRSDTNECDTLSE